MLTTVQAARILNVHPNTLVNWRWGGLGPKYTKRKNRVYYSGRDILRYRNKMQGAPRKAPGRLSRES